MNLVIVSGDTWHRYEGRKRVESAAVNFPDGVKLMDVLELLESFGKVKHMQTVKALITKLSNYYWSPRHPSTYLIDVEGRVAGAGLLAKDDYAAFNLAWLKRNGKLETQSDHFAFVRTFIDAKVFTSLTVGGMELSWALTSKTEPEFVQWYLQAHSIPADLKAFLSQSVEYELQQLRRI